MQIIVKANNKRNTFNSYVTCVFTEMEVEGCACECVKEVEDVRVCICAGRRGWEWFYGEDHKQYSTVHDFLI